MTLMKVGQWVHANIPSVTATTGTSSASLTSNTAINAAFRPAAVQFCPCFVNNNAAGVTSPMGLIRAETNGTFTIRRDSSAAAFTDGASAGLSVATNFVYFVG